MRLSGRKAEKYKEAKCGMVYRASLALDGLLGRFQFFLSLLGVCFLRSWEKGKIIVYVLQIHCTLVNIHIDPKIGCFEEEIQIS